MPQPVLVALALSDAEQLFVRLGLRVGYETAPEALLLHATPHASFHHAPFLGLRTRTGVRHDTNNRFHDLVALVAVGHEPVIDLPALRLEELEHLRLGDAQARVRCLLRLAAEGAFLLLRAAGEVIVRIKQEVAHQVDLARKQGRHGLKVEVFRECVLVKVRKVRSQDAHRLHALVSLRAHDPVLQHREHLILEPCAQFLLLLLQEINRGRVRCQPTHMRLSHHTGQLRRGRAVRSIRVLGVPVVVADRVEHVALHPHSESYDVQDRRARDRVVATRIKLKRNL